MGVMVGHPNTYFGQWIPHRSDLLIADNTGFEDAHPFNQTIFEDSDWESVNLWTFLPGHSPENDGLCFALKRS